jgi:competence protein ComEC
MSCLRATIIDVGWGDSILLESQNQTGKWTYALIDCNDSVTSRSSHTFLKRFFERKSYAVPFTGSRAFDWVLLTHAHADHGQGLKRVLKDFGANRFWYPQSHGKPVFFTDLVRFATRSLKVRHHQPVDSTYALPQFGDATMDILWPPRNTVAPNENNNSVVLALTLDKVTFVLTGDAEADGVWNQIAGRIPRGTKLFKVPHHGADNGMFDAANNTPWLNALGPSAAVGISSHVEPFRHPSPQVIAQLNAIGTATYRTDEHYHVTFETDGKNLTVQYSHV